MRVIKLGESSNDSDNHEKPEKAWGLDEDNDSSTMWFPNLKSIRKYHHLRLKLGTASSHIRNSSIEKFAKTVDILRIVLRVLPSPKLHRYLRVEGAQFFTNYKQKTL